MKGLQAVQSVAEQGAEGDHVRQASRQLPLHLRRLLSVKQLAVQLDFVTTAPGNPERACRNWLWRHKVVGLKRGRVILVDPRDIDRALRAL